MFLDLDSVPAIGLDVFGQFHVQVVDIVLLPKNQAKLSNWYNEEKMPGYTANKKSLTVRKGR